MDQFKTTLATLNERINQKQFDFIQLLLGPRQVGKTTILTEILKDYKKPFFYASADDVISLSTSWIYEQWSMAISISEKCLLVIDEIQKISQWSDIIKKLWDQQKIQKKTKIRLILTGSSSLSIQKGLTESLTGRFELIRAYHWGNETSAKICKLSFDNFLEFGGYPGSYKLLKNKQRWGDYINSSIIETVIGKDILIFNQVKSPALFKQSFQIIMSYPAQVISYNKLLGQLQDRGNIDLIKYYLELFEGAFLIKCIFKYGASEIKKKGSSPKIIPMAPALINRKLFFSDEGKGRVFESVVGAELIKAGFELHYWCDGDFEVDYVLELNNQLVAIEVKSQKNRKAKSIEVFLKKFPDAIIVIINKENFNQFEKGPEKFITKQLRF